MGFKGRNSINKLIGPYEGIGFQEREVNRHEDKKLRVLKD